MNNRIKELYTKAYCMAFDEADDKNFLDHHMEKFAELIVRECQHRVEQYINECGEVASMPKSVIMKHFGVEE